MRFSRVGLTLAAFVVLLIIVASQRGQGTPNNAATPGATKEAAAAPADPNAPPTLVVPTPAIPLPRSCPPQTAAQVDNPGRYGFCTPIGWGAYNNNNSISLTLVMKPKPGGPPVLLPTEFDRIMIVVGLNTGASADTPPECKAAPNDSIQGLAAHHCSAPLDPERNPYHGSRAEFWSIDLFADQKFYMTAISGAEATDEDRAMIDLIIHNVQPPSGR